MVVPINPINFIFIFFILYLMTTNKTPIRLKLESLEDDIHKSYLRDMNKLEEMQQITKILDEIGSKESIESYFENESDTEYFLKKFTPETIKNILRQNVVVGNDGEEIALELLLAYLRLFTKFFDKPYFSLFESVKEIFDYSKNFYKSSYYATKSNNEKKHMSADKFNVISFFI